MRLNVLRELRQPLGSVTEYEINEPSLKVDGVALEALAGTATLLRTDEGLLVSLRIAARMPEQCARCLAATASEVLIDFQEEYVPTIDAATGAPVRMPKGADVFRIEPNFDLDLREALRQYILMCEPAKPLCTPQCAGLCPGCGADLNVDACRCASAADERWSVLAGFKNDRQEGSK